MVERERVEPVVRDHRVQHEGPHPGGVAQGVLRAAERSVRHAVDREPADVERTAQGVIRIEFTAQDIARTRVATTFGPFAETVLGLGALRMARHDRIAPPWRRADRTDTELATFLSPRGVVQVDLFTLTGPAGEFAEAAEALLGVPEESLAAEISAVRCCDGSGEPRWLTGIRQAELPARRRLLDAVDRTYRRVVAVLAGDARRARGRAGPAAT